MYVRGEYLREDFYFRIATVVIELPPLRLRLEDVLMLAQHFVRRLAGRYGRRIMLARSDGASPHADRNRCLGPSP